MNTRFATHTVIGVFWLFTGLALAGLPVHAESVEQTVNKLLGSEQPAAALAAVESALQNEPGRTEYRFMRAVVLSEMGRFTEALELFQQLSKELPTSPEPLNNLGVLHARQGQLEDARLALMAAVAKDSGYAIAYENLGDVDARLAAQAYEKALQLAPGNTTTPSKLQLVSQIAMPSVGSAARSATLSARGRITKGANAPPLVAAVPAQPVKGLTASAASVPAAVPTVPAIASAEAKAVQAAVTAWAQAWSRRDTDAYLACYTHDYAPSSTTRSAWEQLRRARIEGKSAITVNLKDLSALVQGSQATATFLQEYTADGLKLRDRKTLHLVSGTDGWRIDGEIVDKL